LAIGRPKHECSGSNSGKLEADIASSGNGDDSWSGTLSKRGKPEGVSRHRGQIPDGEVAFRGGCGPVSFCLETPDWAVIEVKKINAVQNLSNVECLLCDVKCSCQSTK